MENLEPDFDVALSFSSDHRDYVSEVADGLTRRGVRLFYDDHSRSALIGQELMALLQDVYSRRTATVAAFISSEWVTRPWPAHERRAALAHVFFETTPGQSIFLPFRFDDTRVPGLPSTFGYEDLRQLRPGERPWHRNASYRAPQHTVELIIEVLGGRGIISQSRKKFAGLTQAAIEQPASGMRCAHAVACSGTVTDLPRELDLWLVTEPSGASFHPDDGPIEVEGHRWSGTAYIGHHRPGSDEEGLFLIHIVAANRVGSHRFREYLDRAHKRGTWPGLTDLDNAVVLATKRVIRDDRVSS